MTLGPVRVMEVGVTVMSYVVEVYITKQIWLSECYDNLDCHSVLSPNGTINCSLGDDGVPSSCSFTCNTGYELTGSYTRTCQSDGSWSGSDTMCTRGNLAPCHT